MRALERNTQDVYYSNMVGETEVRDENGFLTGEREQSYGSPIAVKAVVSPRTNSTDVTEFGTFVNYDRVITVYERELDITETSRIWIDSDTSEPNDYEVERISRHPNCTVVAVAEVHHGNL